MMYASCAVNTTHASCCEVNLLTLSSDCCSPWTRITPFSCPRSPSCRPRITSPLAPWTLFDVGLTFVSFAFGFTKCPVAPLSSTKSSSVAAESAWPLELSGLCPFRFCTSLRSHPWAIGVRSAMCRAVVRAIFVAASAAKDATYAAEPAMTALSASQPSGGRGQSTSRSSGRQQPSRLSVAMRSHCDTFN